MAAYRSSDAANGGASSVTVTKPAGLAENDLMVAVVHADGQTINTPSGWTSITQVTSSTLTQKVAVFAKIASAADAAAADFTFTCAASVGIECILYALSGTFASTANLYAYSVDNTGTEAVSDVYRCPVAITPAAASSVLIMAMAVFCTDSDNNAMSAYALETSSPTWTERHEIQDNGASNDLRFASATATRTEVTSTGYFQAAVSTGAIDATASIGVLLAVNDTANGTATPAVIDATLAVQAPAATGGATVSPAVIDTTIAVQAPTAAASEALWKNTDKPSAGTIANTDKP